MRVLVTGASGSGTTTLGEFFASRNGWKHVDADDYYWLPTDPPYQTKREPALRLEMILRAVHNDSDVIVSGSIMNWGRELEDSFELIAFLYLDASIRVARLRIREEQELGSADSKFLLWASQYDTGPTEGGRSLARHLQWLSERSCTVIKIEGDLSVERRCQLLESSLQGALSIRRGEVGTP